MPVFLQLDLKSEIDDEDLTPFKSYFPGSNAALARSRSSSVLKASGDGNLTKYTQRSEKVEYRWEQLWNIGLFAGWQLYAKTIVITETWEQKEGSDEKLNYSITEQVYDDWHPAYRRAGNTEAVTFGFVPADQVNSWIINPPAGLKIGTSISLDKKEVNESQRQFKESQLNKSQIIMDQDNIQDITKSAMKTDLYEKVLLPASSKSDDPEAIYLGFKRLLKDSEIDPLTIKSWAKVYEGEIVEKAIRERKNLIIKDIQLVDTKTTRDKDGIVISYCDYLIMLGLIDE